MKVYIAKDWTGPKVFAEPPKLIQCGGMPPIWSGYKLPLNTIGLEDEIPRNQYIEKNLVWWYLSKFY